MGASAAANAIRGIGQAKKAKGLEAEFQRLDKALTPVSPEQYAQLARTRQLERSMRLGTDPTSAMARQGLAGSLAQTQANLVRAGGGAGTVNALLRSQTGYGQGIGQVAAQAARGADQMLAYQGGLIDNIQNAIYGLQMKRRNYAQAVAAQMRQAATDSATAAIGSFAQAATMIPEMNKSAPADGGQEKLLPKNYQLGQLTQTPQTTNYGFGYNATPSNPSIPGFSATIGDYASNLPTPSFAPFQ